MYDRNSSKHPRFAYMYSPRCISFFFRPSLWKTSLFFVWTLRPDKGKMGDRCYALSSSVKSPLFLFFSLNVGDGRVIAPLIRTPFLRKTVVAILFLEEVGPYVTLRPHLPPTPGEERRGEETIMFFYRGRVRRTWKGLLCSCSF